jgi:hypothetical protein
MGISWCTNRRSHHAKSSSSLPVVVRLLRGWYAVLEWLHQTSTSKLGSNGATRGAWICDGHL